MITINDLKKEFLDNEIFILAWGASVQHNQVYAENVFDKEKQKFKEYVKAFVESDILPKYRNTVSEENHYKNIELLQNKIQSKYKNLLNGGTYKIGTAQKLLNLLLKYYWCLG